jgi:hypothetical protein
MIVRPAFALLCLGALLGLQYHAIMNDSFKPACCVDGLFVVCIVAWLTQGGLWTACPECGDPTGAVLSSPRYRGVNLLEWFDRSSWLARALARVSLPCYCLFLRGLSGLSSQSHKLAFVAYVNTALSRRLLFWLLMFVHLFLLQSILVGIAATIAAPVFLGQVALLIVVEAVVLCISGTALRKHLTRRWREWVKDLGGIFCFNCGYRLHAVQGRVCPECGQEAEWEGGVGSELH